MATAAEHKHKRRKTNANLRETETMFVYLSKKIAIPNNTQLRCIAWDQENGYLACGGDEGLLKILKLDAKAAGPSQSSLTINQTLEGHNGSVTAAVWNETNQRLTTSDQNGLIIVWMFVKGQWFEEMINNRNKSVVKGMAWTSDGQKICIVYEDGAVIVGSVDGNRLWGKDLKNSQLVGVAWSPDSKVLLFAHSNGEVHIHDSSGLFVSRVAVKAVSDGSHVVAMHWIPCLNYNQAPTLAIGYSNGFLQLLRNENDEEPVSVESGLVLKSLQWSHNGTVLAVAGSLAHSNSPSSNCIRFYDPLGDLVHEFKLPGQSLSGVSWEGFSLRLALGVESYIYLAQVKLDHCWSFFCNTLAYHFTKKGKGERYVMFWDTKNNERYVKQVKDLLAIASNGEHCVLATRLDDTESDEVFHSKFGLILCNALGTPVDSKYIQLELAFVAMTKNYVIASSRKEFMVWHYRTPKSRIGLEFSALKKDARDQTISFEEVMPGVDGVCCMCTGSSVVIFGTTSGHVLGFTLPSLQFIGHAVLPSRPSKLYLNCNTSKLAVIDTSGILRMLQMDSSSGIPCFGTMFNFERKDVWNLEWASDNAELFAVMEKTRMYVFRNLDPEEPVVSSAYLCSFKDLEIVAVSLDDLLKDPENPSKESLVTMETKSLRDTRNLLDKVGIKEAQLFVEENSHPRLWKLLADFSLQKLDLEAAETSFVRCGDFASLQLLHRLKKLPKDSPLLKAEVAAYFGKFDEAEQMFLASDRRDLAVALRRKLGNWSRVADLQKGLASITNDLETKSNFDKMGRYYADRYQWAEAAKYFELSDSSERLVDCYLHLEDYESLEKLSLRLNENDPLLAKIAAHFAAVGLCDLAAQSYLKCHQAKLALEMCCTLNQWNSAVTLAKQVQLPGIASRLAAHTHRVLEQHRLTEAVQLLRKANCFTEAASLLFQEAEKQLQKKCDPLRMKKLFVLAALLADEQKLQPQEGFSFMQNKSSRFLDAPWRAAEAFHLLLVAQRHLGRGSAAAAMAAAFKLQDYEDILDPEMIYSLLALASAANKCFGTCSKAFIRLESLSELSTSERETYSLLAVDIFTRSPPKDGRQNRNECPQCHSTISSWMPTCLECGLRFATCMVTGQPLQNSASVWNCKVCKRSAAEHEMITRNSCPLCHSPVQGV